MPPITLSSRELSEDIDGARSATRDGPVIITEDGHPAQVLLSIEEFRRLQGVGRNIADLLFMPELGDADLAIPKRSIEPSRPIDLG